MLSAAFHWLGYGLCHQLPARTLAAGGYLLPVCARDTGIYLGFVVAVAVAALLDRGRHRSGMPAAWLMGLGLAAVAWLGWDGVSSYLGLRPTTNLLRLATGTGTGFALALVMVPLLNTQLWKRRSEEQVLGSTLEGLAWCVAAPIAFAAFWWGGPLLGVLFPLLVSVAILVTFGVVNLVLVSLIPRFERSFDRLRDAWPALLLSLVLTLAELALADAARLALVSLAARL